MQAIRYLTNWMERHATSERYLFTLQDLRGLFPELRESALKALLSRAVKTGPMSRICRGLYAYTPMISKQGRLLFHAAAHVRAHAFNYISLETALSEAGVISQMPINRITIMSSGRKTTLSCGSWGAIEFIHTNQKAEALTDELVYDASCRLWRARVALAIRDMKRAHRNCDLIDWEVVRDFI